jgi:hypothetical protein
MSMGEFNVIKTWANWDSIHENIVDTAVTVEEANQKAQALRDKAPNGVAYIVKPASDGVENTYHEVDPSIRGDFEGIHASLNEKLASALLKSASILSDDEEVNSDAALQALVGDPDDARTSTFAQHSPNPGTMQLPNPGSPIEGDDIFFTYMIPGSRFQDHNGREWMIQNYTGPDNVEIYDVWYPKTAPIVSLNDVRRSIHQWTSPITQTVPPPPPGVDYGSQPVKIMDGPARYGAPDELTDYQSGLNGGW